MPATYEGDPQILVFGRDWKYSFTLFEADGVTPLAVDSGADKLKLRVWATDGASPAFHADNDGSTPSTLSIDVSGTAGVTSAVVTAHLHRTDTDGLTVGTQYYGELTLDDASDSHKIKSLCKFPITVIGTAT